MNRLDVVRKNLDWFQRSGVMRPSDGFWGVAERIAILSGNSASEKISDRFPCQTRPSPGAAILEHRRADCAIQTALLFDLAAGALSCPGHRETADNLISFLMRRSGLRQTDPKSERFGLWAWAMPIRMDTWWTDDNAWVATLLLQLADRGRPDLREPGLQTVRALQRHTEPFFRGLREQGREAPEPEGGMSGLRLNPHWMGLLTMALARGAAADPGLMASVTDGIETYHAIVLDGPPIRDEQSRKQRQTNLPWPVSEYAYLSLTATVATACTHSPAAERVARAACDILLDQQHPDGHFTAEWVETPAGSHLADLIYTQNWATLGLYHAARHFKSEAYRRAFETSLNYLARIQDASPDPLFHGCWRGMYDNRKGGWGGGDCYEGGANSIYTGWTNAPIAWAFLFAETEESLLPGSRPGKAGT